MNSAGAGRHSESLAIEWTNGAVAPGHPVVQGRCRCAVLRSMAVRSRVLNALRTSICTATQSRSVQLSAMRWRPMPISSAANGRPTPHCRGCRLLICCKAGVVLRRTLPTRRRSVSPTAIGLMPPSFLVSGMRVLAHRASCAACGSAPAHAALTKAPRPICSACVLPGRRRQSFKWAGRRPDGPGAEPGGKRDIAWRAHCSHSWSSAVG